MLFQLFQPVFQNQAFFQLLHLFQPLWTPWERQLGRLWKVRVASQGIWKQNLSHYQTCGKCGCLLIVTRHFSLPYILFSDFDLGFRMIFLVSFLLYHLGKPKRKKPNPPDDVLSIFIYKSDREVSKPQNKLKRYQSMTKKSGECSGSGNVSKKVLYECIQ